MRYYSYSAKKKIKISSIIHKHSTKRGGEKKMHAKKRTEVFKEKPTSLIKEILGKCLKVSFFFFSSFSKDGNNELVYLN